MWTLCSYLPFKKSFIFIFSHLTSHSIRNLWMKFFKSKFYKFKLLINIIRSCGVVYMVAYRVKVQFYKYNISRLTPIISHFAFSSTSFIVGLRLFFFYSKETNGSFGQDITMRTIYYSKLFIFSELISGLYELNIVSFQRTLIFLWELHKLSGNNDIVCFSWTLWFMFCFN